ncbi:DUF1707 SHOCT-like domain-containing protein [Tessaracoccus caeni]|uniref:DUF1707 SHOCT-like domain-containing protein n=1 Tax=Tessaracoccus caeni TaxID=3031239 RepID=UPI0023DA9152|nr:DUF1707 domain-containing protein [Tessaracoccus caeni]MDF1487531.1 DUF1707 domain-containing protein [Tessaracoccus caeni]
MSEAEGIEHLRCADQDRELVAEVLNAAYADGRLSFDEHADRIAAAYDAKTYKELNKLTSDLIPAAPKSPQRFVPPPPPQRGYGYPPAPATPRAPHIAPATSRGFDGGNAHLSSLRPGRITLLEPVVKLSTVMGDVHLDLIGTTFAHQEIQLDTMCIMGEIKIRVPEGVGVRTENINPVLGEVKVEGLVPVPGGVTLLLSGLVLMGEIKIYGPAMDERKYRKLIK